MSTLQVAVIVVLVIIVIFILSRLKSEKLTGIPGRELCRIQLYETDGLVYDSYPVREMVRVDLKGYDIDMSQAPPTAIVELWKLDEMSTDAGFYNTYTESPYALKANTAKYQFIDRIYGGQKVSKYPVFPVKKLFIMTNMI